MIAKTLKDNSKFWGKVGQAIWYILLVVLGFLTGFFMVRGENGSNTSAVIIVTCCNVALAVSTLIMTRNMVKMSNHLAFMHALFDVISQEKAKENEGKDP